MSYTVLFKNGNIADQKRSTFIVNASNTRLLLGSGVSMAIKRKCGNEVEKMMQLIYEKYAPFYKGDVVLTKAGDCQSYTYILHAITIDNKKGLRGEEKFPTLKDIENALINIEKYLIWYAQKYVKEISLTLPLLGTGHGGLDKQEVIGLYKSFFARSSAFKCETTIYYI